MKDLGRGATTRRMVLRGGLVGALGLTAAALAGCGEPQIVEKEVVKVVTQEVPVEKIVTQIVEKKVEVPVEKIVTQVVKEVVVQEKIVEKIVTAESMTPKPITGTVVFWDWFTPTESEQAKKWFAWLPSQLKAQNPDLDFRIEHVPFDQVMPKFLAASAAKNAPDAMHTSVDWGLALFLRGQLTEFSPYVKTNPEMSLDKFVDVAKTFSVFRGQQYATPWDSPDSRIYWYNKTMLEAAGIDPSYEKVSEWTWDEFTENAKKLTLREGNDVKQAGYLVAIPNQEILAALMHSQGKGFFNDDFSKLQLSDGEEAKRSVELYLTLLKEVSPPLTAERQDRQIFFQGGAAMVTGGNWWVSALRQQAPDMDGDMSPYPNGGVRSAATTWLNNLTLPKSSKNPDGGWRFIEFYTSFETYRSYLSVWNRSGPRKEIVTAPEYAASVAAEPLLAREADITAKGGYDPSFMLWSELGPIYGPRMEKIFVQGADVATELKAIDDEFNPILDKFFKEASGG